jgi:hypothetical protein
VLAEAASHDWFYRTAGHRSWLIDPKMLEVGRSLTSLHTESTDELSFGEPGAFSGSAPLSFTPSAWKITRL